MQSTNTYFDVFDDLLLTEAKEKLKNIRIKKELKMFRS